VGRLSVAVTATLAFSVTACQTKVDEVRQEAQLRELVRQRVPGIEQATGLTFKEEPRLARRTRDQVRQYLLRQLDADVPPAEFAAIATAYKLFGLVPDTLDLREALLAVLAEQVAGYYDADSSTLFVVADVDSFALRMTLSHELVHALQDQYLPLDSLLRQKHQNDRAMAAKAILEGQATLAQTLAMMPEKRRDELPSFWEQRSVLYQQQGQMKEFARAPLYLREWLVFPYLAGADFVRAFEQAHPGQQPYGAALPVSTEQILHPDRYAAGDQPTALTFTGPAPDTVRLENDLGEFEIRILFQQLLNDQSGARAAALAEGWDGDRYQLLGRDDRSAVLVWYTVWDDLRAANRFRKSLERAWAGRHRPGRTSRIEDVTIGDHTGVRLVDAPTSWNGWTRLPQVTLGLRQSPK
jgi:hypothetical protein